MVQVPFSVLGVLALIVPDSKTDIDVYLASALGDVNNGLERMGWTHLSDRGLAESEYIRVHPAWYVVREIEWKVHPGQDVKDVFKVGKENFQLKSGSPLVTQIAVDLPGVRADLKAREPHLQDELIDELAYGSCFIRAQLVQTGCVDREYIVCNDDPSVDERLKVAA